MSSYAELEARLAEGKLDFTKEMHAALGKISKLRAKQLGQGEQHVAFYASGFLQGHDGSMLGGDINGFMRAFHKVKGKSLTLILHTPGGSGVEDIVPYLTAKHDYIEVVVPVTAMSAGTVISLASDHIIMSKAGQLGPVDAQMLTEGGEQRYSAMVVRDAIGLAEDRIAENPEFAALWVPLLQSVGSLQSLEAYKEVERSLEMVKDLLESRKLLTDEKEAGEVSAYFNASESKYGQIHVHNQPIGLKKLGKMPLNVETLEDSQELQDAVMTAYWLMTLIFEEDDSPSKFIASSVNGIITI